MSTTYYKIRDGFTLERVPPVVVNIEAPSVIIRAAAGQIIGAIHEDYARMVAGDDHAAVRSGGRTTVYATGLDSDYAVSEYGEIVTLGQLRRNEQP